VAKEGALALLVAEAEGAPPLVAEAAACRAYAANALWSLLYNYQKVLQISVSVCSYVWLFCGRGGGKWGQR
jgi:hypothetical protein